MKVAITCTYCDHKWESTIMMSSVGLRCPRCSDKNLKVKDLTKTKVDYYVGCPPFPVKSDSYEGELRREDADSIFSDYMGGTD